MKKSVTWSLTSHARQVALKVLLKFGCQFDSSHVTAHLCLLKFYSAKRKSRPKSPANFSPSGNPGKFCYKETNQTNKQVVVIFNGPPVCLLSKKEKDPS